MMIRANNTRAANAAQPNYQTVVTPGSAAIRSSRVTSGASSTRAVAAISLSAGSPATMRRNAIAWEAISAVISATSIPGRSRHHAPLEWRPVDLDAALFGQ
jgi:hypothetical protein